MGHPVSPSRPPISIYTNGFVLRSLSRADVTDRFIEWLGSTPMLTGLNLPGRAFDRAQVENMVARGDNLNIYLIGIFEAKSGLLVGFYEVDVNQFHRTAYLTAGIGESAWLGQNVLYVTSDALLDYFFNSCGIDKVTTHVHTRNLRMVYNFVNNLRFVFELCLRDECLMADGRRADMYVFSAFRASVGPQPAGGPYASVPWQ
jgi:RimJ/RimL family protein N-acetyltransferase